MHLFSINPFRKTWCRSRDAERLLKLILLANPKPLKENKSNKRKILSSQSKPAKLTFEPMWFSWAHFQRAEENSVSFAPVFFPE